MAQSIIISFRVPDDICERVLEQAEKVPRLAGQDAPSRHEMAKALMIEALEAREKRTRKDK